MNTGLFFAFYAFCLLWVAGVVAASVVHRQRRGKPVWPTAPAGATFVEARCSGRSLRSVLTRFGGARNCLLVYVAAGKLVVTPSFPFTLMFLPEIYGLDCSAPISTLTATVQNSLMGRVVRVEFAGHAEAPLELRLRNPEDFLAAIGATPHEIA